MTRFGRGSGIAVAALVGPATAVAAPCPPNVVIEGPAALRDQVVAALAARAVGSDPRPPCPPIRARLEADEAGVVVWVTDAEGRVSQRRVGSPAAAAIVIESWARPELDAMLLRAESGAQHREPERPPVVVHGAAPAASGHSPVRLALGADTAVGSDGSLWLGLSGLACVRFGPACVGALGRLSQDTKRSGDSERLETARRAVELMLVLDLPRSLAGWIVTPGAQLGLGFNRSTGTVDPATGQVEIDGGGPRAGVHFGASTRLATRWAIGFAVAVDAALFQPAASDPIDPEAVRLAGQPRGFMRAGLQLRFEGP